MLPSVTEQCLATSCTVFHVSLSLPPGEAEANQVPPTSGTPVYLQRIQEITNMHVNVVISQLLSWFNKMHLDPITTRPSILVRLHNIVHGYLW